MAAAFLALCAAFGQTANAATGALLSRPGSLIQWGNADTSSELTNEDGIVTQPIKATANHKHHKRHHHLQRKHVALGVKKQHLHKHRHRKRRARHTNRSNTTIRHSVNSTLKSLASLQNQSHQAQSQTMQPNGTSRGRSGLVAWHSKMSEADPTHLSTLNTNMYSSQLAPQVILDKEKKIGQLEEQNDRVSVDFHKLDAAYHDQEIKMASLRRRFENDQDSISKGSQELEEAFAQVAQKESERKKLLQDQQSVEKVIEEQKAKNAHLVHALQLKDSAERTLREQSANLRKQVTSDEQNDEAMEAATQAELKNQTKMLEMAKSKGQKLKQELKALETRLKDQQVDKEDLKNQQETLADENNRLTTQNEKLERLQSEKVGQLKALQGEVRDDRAEHAELQHELDTLETTGTTDSK